MAGQIHCTPPWRRNKAATWHAAADPADVYPAMIHGGLEFPAPRHGGFLFASALWVPPSRILQVVADALFSSQKILRFSITSNLATYV